MKANVTKAELIVALAHLLLPICPERQGRMPASNGMLPEVWECCRLVSYAAAKLETVHLSVILSSCSHS
jgi:hypothetical protein